MNARSSLLPLVSLAGLVLGCDPAILPAPVDAAIVDAALPTEDGGHDAGQRRLGYVTSAEFPVPIAFGQAIIRRYAGRRYLYVIGGADATRTTLAPYSSVYRAEVIGDGTLGPWIASGDIGDPGEALAIVGHDLIALNGDDGSDGVALAGGGTAESALPFVLGGYVQEDGSFGHWGYFDPRLDVGQSFGSFDPFEAHQLALIGGLRGADPTADVRIAAIENGAMSPTWRPGPSLPEARFGHASFVYDEEVFLVGGEGVDGPISEILHTQRDGSAEVESWTAAGTLDSAPTFGLAYVHHDQVWVFGGLSGGRATGDATARVLRADIGSDGHIGAFSRVPGGDLPVALAASASVYDDGYVYIVGGLTGDPLASSTAVVIGTLP